MELSDFKFKTTVKVRNYEVDWQGIVHNTVYLLYCEIGRVEYLKHIGASLDLNSVNSESRVVLSRNDIIYHAPARFDMKLSVYTRISEIGNTSFVFEGLIYAPDSKNVIAENKAYHVWLDSNSENGRPVRVPDKFRELVRNFEGKQLIEKG